MGCDLNYCHCAIFGHRRETGIIHCGDSNIAIAFKTSDIRIRRPWQGMAVRKESFERLKSKDRKWQEVFAECCNQSIVSHRVSRQSIDRSDNETSAADKLSDESLHNVSCHTSNKAMLPCFQEVFSPLESWERVERSSLKIKPCKAGNWLLGMPTWSLTRDLFWPRVDFSMSARGAEDRMTFPCISIQRRPRLTISGKGRLVVCNAQSLKWFVKMWWNYKTTDV